MIYPYQTKLLLVKTSGSVDYAIQGDGAVNPRQGASAMTCSGRLHNELLTKRQTQVLEAVASRKSIKQIARELGVSESAVNQRIKALKLVFGVNSLGELAEQYRLMSGVKAFDTCRKTASRKKQLPLIQQPPQNLSPEDVNPVVTFHDAVSYEALAPWDQRTGQNIVPEVLNGANAAWVRTAAIICVAVGTLLLALVGLGVAQGLTSAITAQSSSLEAQQ